MTVAAVYISQGDRGLWYIFLSMTGAGDYIIVGIRIHFNTDFDGRF